MFIQISIFLPNLHLFKRLYTYIFKFLFSKQKKIYSHPYTLGNKKCLNPKTIDPQQNNKLQFSYLMTPHKKIKEYFHDLNTFLLLSLTKQSSYLHTR